MRKKILTLLLFSFSLFAFVVPVSAQYGLDVSVNSACKADSGTCYGAADDPYKMVTLVVNIGLGMIAVLFFGLILYAGLRWMTAQGNEEKVTKAKDVIQAAIIGLVVVSAAYAISNLIFTKLVTGGSTAESAADMASTEEIDCAFNGGLCMPKCEVGASFTGKEIGKCPHSSQGTACCEAKKVE